MNLWSWDDDTGKPDWERLMIGLRDGGFLGQEDGVHMRGLASLNRGWLARGGLLRLRDDGLTFEPNPLERLLLARPGSYPFSQILRIERRPRRPDEVSPLGQSPRIRLHLEGEEHVDVLPAGGPDAWLDAIRERRAIWVRRRRFAHTQAVP